MWVSLSSCIVVNAAYPVQVEPPRDIHNFPVTFFQEESEQAGQGSLISLSCGWPGHTDSVEC